MSSKLIMPTLLQINIVLNLSTGRIAEEIGQTAINNGWGSYIAYGRNDKLSESKKIKIGNSWDINLHGLKSRIFDKHGFGSTNATKELIKQIEDIKPDIIHLHNIHGYYINIEILFNYLATIDTQVVWTMHDCWSITGHCAYFSYVNCEKWKTHCERCPQKNSYPASFLFDNSFNNYEIKRKLFTNVDNMTLVPVSNWLADIMKESFLNNYPIKVINNGIDLETFSPKNTDNIKQKYQLYNKFVLLGVASTWSSRKGLDDFIKLSALLKKDELIVLVGLSKKQLISLPDNIIGIERTENINELAELYSIADVVCNLSVEETFGLTTVEGFACGTPSIVYNCTASPELLNDKVGFIVEQEDFDGLREKIDLLKKNGKEFYSSHCRQRAIERYDKNKKYQEYINLYNSLL